MKHPECGKGTPDRGKPEYLGKLHRAHGQQHAPDLGPGDDNEKETDVDQVADIDNDGEEPDETHHLIVAVPIFPRALST